VVIGSVKQVVDAVFLGGDAEETAHAWCPFPGWD
jgi:hypothetical protein